ncbi:aspartyl-phosphate phosphatase Spo0E family protein [Bacillus sp. 03113]|uniref:aspartyl-phosphate phosphatase Spo0E family protein n=1 Tax=Bacillus sp. 03113 TaxID=2578211 RepID=UPI0011446A0B|nr:aspartyl-phosphate phosphatase Spo0E family protein [Bacillus sp. 03113]
MRVHELLTEIEKSRKEMVSLASQHSFSHQQVVEASTKLDHLLNKYYLLIKK